MKPRVKYDMTILNDFVNGLDKSRQFQVKVGIMGSEVTRDEGKGSTNVDIGRKHEYGSFADHIPMRSFLRMPIFMKAKEILKITSVAAEDKLLAGNIKGVLEMLGVACEQMIGQGFSTGGFGQWEPLAPLTVEKKGHSLILIQSRQMERSVTSKVVKRGN